MSAETVTVHPLTDDPTKAWEEISKTQKFFKINYKPPRAPNADPKKLRVVCMSDTHSLYHCIKFTIPHGDVFIHAGNFTAGGSPEEIAAFDAWLGRLPHPHKLIVAGNHELSLDPDLKLDLSATTTKKEARSGLLGKKRRESSAAEDVRRLLTNAILLEDSGVEICDVHFYGSPWQPAFGPWAFGLPRGRFLLEKWNAIPARTDVLITHTPPVGFCDRTARGEHSGCVELLATIQQRVQPKYAVFGHVHDAYGVMTDGRTVFVNASTCDINYKPNNFPVVFDIEKSEKSDEVIVHVSENDENEAEKAVTERRTPWLVFSLVARYFQDMLRRMFWFWRRF